ncbi:MAG TPA: hypothetical protein VF282_04845, partial [Bacillota bacterium]
GLGARPVTSGRRVIYATARGMRVRAAAGTPGRPTAVVAGSRIVDCCRRAAAAGVEAGMGVRQARRLCPALRTVTLADDDRRLAALAEILHQALYDLTPVVEPDPPVAAFAAVHLTRRYGESELLADLRRLSRRVCPHAADALVIGVAGSRFAAYAVVSAPGAADTLVPGGAWAARSAQAAGAAEAAQAARGEPVGEQTAGGRLRLVVAPNDIEAWLAPLPVEALWPLPSAVHRRLRGLGLQTLGDVARAGRQALAAELGAAGATAAELARGIDRSGVTPRYPPPQVEACCRPEGGLAGLRQVEAAALEAAAHLAARLARRAEGARLLRLLLEGEAPVSRVREFSLPAARPETLREAARTLAREALAQVKGGDGASTVFTGVHLAARSLQPLPVRQQALWEQPPDPSERRDRVDRLLGDLRRRFPERAVRAGSQLTVPRRERMLAFWDPYRFDRRLWEPS